MAIIDIVEFIQEYINKISFLNYGEFYYETKEEIINFSTNLINSMVNYFGDNCLIISYDSNNVVAKIQNSIYNISIKNTTNENYEWIVKL
jgi:imidazole glycerol phosphate synthase subunit HisF